MDSITRGALISTISPTEFSPTRPKPSNFTLSSHPQSRVSLNVSVKVSSSFNPEVETKNPMIERLRKASKVLIFTTAAALMIGRVSQSPARAESPVSVVQEEEKLSLQQEDEPLSQLIESNSEAIEALKEVLRSKLEVGEDEEALKILKKLISAQPEELEWKFLLARLYNEIGDREEARKVYDEILEKDPLSFDALFQNAVLMDQCGEGQAAIRLLEDKLTLAQEELKDNEARNVRFILAQIQYLQKNVDEALQSYEELAQEDPADYRPYFYRFVIYSLLDRNEEAKMQFAKCREVCPKDFKVEGFMQTPLSRTKVMGSDN